MRRVAVPTPAARRDDNRQPVSRSSPSAWSKRLPVIVLSLVGCGLAAYLTLFQVGLLTEVWEPFFGNGSRVILKESAIARWSPVPDAALGAMAYLAEALAECCGGSQRWRSWPAAVFVTGVLAGALALATIGLVGSQVFWFQTYCTLCLASAACSLIIAGLVAPEISAAWRNRQGIHRAGSNAAAAHRNDGATHE